MEQTRVVTPQDFKDLMNFIVNESRDLKRMIQEKYEQLEKKMFAMAKSLSEVIIKIDGKIEKLSSEVEVKAKETDLKLAEMEGNMHKLDKQVIMLQFLLMENAIRLRGLSENPREDLRKVSADALAILVKMDPGEIYAKIDKIYRANSRIALQRQLPRDVVIYFTERNLRNDILQKSFHSSLHIAGKRIGVFKELPSTILKLRRDFGFLVEELKKRGIQYRWDAPMGVIFRYEGVRYCLNTIDKARDFYYEILKKSATPPRISIPTLVDLDGSEQDIEMEQKQFGKEMEEHTQLDSPGLFLSPTLEEMSKTAIGGSVGMPIRKSDEQCEARSSTRQIQKPQKQRRSQSRRVKKDKRIKGRSN